MGIVNAGTEHAERAHAIASAQLRPKPAESLQNLSQFGTQGKPTHSPETIVLPAKRHFSFASLGRLGRTKAWPLGVAILGQRSTFNIQRSTFKLGPSYEPRTPLESWELSVERCKLPG